MKGAGSEPGEQAGILAALARLIADRASHSASHKKKICVFLGAGADISSGGFSFADLKRQTIEEFTHRPLFDVTTPEAIDRAFEEVFRRQSADDRALLIEFLFRRLRPLDPSDSYKLLVLLAEAGGIDAVVTTNFDLMLERAQSLLGRDVFQVFGPGVARPYILSQSRYEPVRKPYLKLHGDLASRSVTFLVPDELEGGVYDSSIVELLQSILATHDMILTGYSGYDRSLARIMANALGKDTRVYWCGPHAPAADAPLFEAIAPQVIYVSATFDQLMMAVARPVLERPTLASTEPTYLECLFDWRIDFTNREYVQAHGYRAGRPISETFARRTTIESRLTEFLRPNRPLAVISGPSGSGKTTIGLRLEKLWRADATTSLMLVRSRALAGSTDLEQYLAEQLGGLGTRGPFTTYHLERWLRQNDRRLVLFVDAINEFSSDFERSVQFFRSILRLCYFLPELDSAIRIIATIRQETWHSILPHLDDVLLRRTLWSEGGRDGGIAAITCGPFSDDELSDAMRRVVDRGDGPNWTTVSPATLAVLHDPYLFGILAGASIGSVSTLGAGIYQQALESRLQRHGSPIGLLTLKDALARVALGTLGSRSDRFREVDIEPASLRAEILRVTKDLGIVRDADQGFLQFDHDRTYEYFLALGFRSRADLAPETLEDLVLFLRRFHNEARAVAAARLYYQLATVERFPSLAPVLRLLDQPSDISDVDRERLFGFARDVLVEMVDANDPVALQYLRDAIDAARSGGGLGPHQLRTVVRAAARLPLTNAVDLLRRAADPSASLAGIEAAILATDILVRAFFVNPLLQPDFLNEAPFSAFFNDADISRWQRLGRLLWFASQIGPDNANADEYSRFAQSWERAFASLRTGGAWTSEDVSAFATYFLANCDRLLFNATPRGIDRFFGNPRRADLIQVLERLASGAVLAPADIAVFEPYTQSLTSDIEYHLGHLFFVLSSLNDLERTLHVTEAHYATFSRSTPPEEIDFFQAVLVYLHVLHGRAYDEKRFAVWEETILRDWTNTLLYRPGLERGERRGFADPFDRVFEDGFGVVYAYGSLMPSNRRRTIPYQQYRRELAGQQRSPLPLYSRFLDVYLSANRIDEALQLLQALAGVAVSWPTEGLLTLKPAIGHNDTRVRRATTRVLAEVFQRHPEEVLEFLRTAGVAVTSDEMVEITIRQDARIGRRQVEEHEWARIGHALLRQPGARSKLVACLRSLLTATSFRAALEAVLQEMGLSPTARL